MVKRIVRYDWKVVKEVKSCILTTGRGRQLVRRRYRLDVTLKRGDENKIALFIMMNPSNADSEVADDTIKKIITYVNKRADDIKMLEDIGKIIFLNLYVVYEKRPNNINKWIGSYGIDFVKGTEKNAILSNDEIIKEAIELADIKFAAWGEADILNYEKRINEINKLMKGKAVFCIGKPTKNGFPRHLSRIDYSWDIQRFY